MPDALRILLDVAIFRLKKLEMANLAAALAVSLVLRLSVPEVGLRLVAAALLNLLVYLNNDYLDVEEDLTAGGRDHARTRFLAEHLGAARRLQWGLVGLLLAIGAAGGAGLLLTVAAGGAICIYYSARLKRVAYADIAAMTLWGAAMPLVGAPLDSRLGWIMAAQLGLFSSVFESLQVLRDRPIDQRAEVRTTAVALGPQKTILLARGLMILTAGFGASFVHPLFGATLAAALLLPLSEEGASADWTRVKMLYGSVWLACCGWLYVAGQCDGLLGGASRADTLPALTALMDLW